MRSLCGPQARLRSEQPVAGNEITARLKFARLGGKKARSAVPPPGATSVRPSATCAQQEWTGLPTRTERPVSSRAPLSTAWLARHSHAIAIFTIAHSGHRVSRRKFAIRAFDAARGQISAPQ